MAGNDPSMYDLQRGPPRVVHRYPAVPVRPPTAAAAAAVGGRTGTTSAPPGLTPPTLSLLCPSTTYTTATLRIRELSGVVQPSTASSMIRQSVHGAAEHPRLSRTQRGHFLFTPDLPPAAPSGTNGGIKTSSSDDDSTFGRSNYAEIRAAAAIASAEQPLSPTASLPPVPPAASVELHSRRLQQEHVTVGRPAAEMAPPSGDDHATGIVDENVFVDPVARPVEPESFGGQVVMAPGTSQRAIEEVPNDDDPLADFVQSPATLNAPLHQPRAARLRRAESDVPTSPLGGGAAVGSGEVGSPRTVLGQSVAATVEMHPSPRGRDAISAMVVGGPRTIAAGRTSSAGPRHAGEGGDHDEPEDHFDDVVSTPPSTFFEDGSPRGSVATASASASAVRSSASGSSASAVQSLSGAGFSDVAAFVVGGAVERGVLDFEDDEREFHPDGDEDVSGSSSADRGVEDEDQEIFVDEVEDSNELYDPKRELERRRERQRDMFGRKDEFGRSVVAADDVKVRLLKSIKTPVKKIAEREQREDLERQGEYLRTSRLSVGRGKYLVKRGSVVGGGGSSSSGNKSGGGKSRRAPPPRRSREGSKDTDLGVVARHAGAAAAARPGETSDGSAARLGLTSEKTFVISRPHSEDLVVERSPRYDLDDLPLGAAASSGESLGHLSAAESLLLANLVNSPGASGQILSKKNHSRVSRLYYEGIQKKRILDAQIARFAALQQERDVAECTFSPNSPRRGPRANATRRYSPTTGGPGFHLPHQQISRGDRTSSATHQGMLSPAEADLPRPEEGWGDEKIRHRDCLDPAHVDHGCLDPAGLLGHPDLPPSPSPKNYGSGHGYGPQWQDRLVKDQTHWVRKKTEYVEKLRLAKERKEQAECRVRHKLSPQNEVLLAHKDYLSPVDGYAQHAADYWAKRRPPEHDPPQRDSDGHRLWIPGGDAAERLEVLKPRWSEARKVPLEDEEEGYCFLHMHTHSSMAKAEGDHERPFQFRDPRDLAPRPAPKGPTKIEDVEYLRRLAVPRKVYEKQPTAFEQRAERRRKLLSVGPGSPRVYQLHRAQKRYRDAEIAAEQKTVEEEDRRRRENMRGREKLVGRRRWSTTTRASTMRMTGRPRGVVFHQEDVEQFQTPNRDGTAADKNSSSPRAAGGRDEESGGTVPASVADVAAALDFATPDSSAQVSVGFRSAAGSVGGTTGSTGKIVGGTISPPVPGGLSPVDTSNSGGRSFVPITRRPIPSQLDFRSNDEVFVDCPSPRERRRAARSESREHRSLVGVHGPSSTAAGRNRARAGASTRGAAPAAPRGEKSTTFQPSPRGHQEETSELLQGGTTEQFSTSISQSRPPPGVTPGPQHQRRLDPSELKSLADRLYTEHASKMEKRRLKKEERERVRREAEMAQCTFQPELHSWTRVDREKMNAGDPKWLEKWKKKHLGLAHYHSHHWAEELRGGEAAWDGGGSSSPGGGSKEAGGSKVSSRSASRGGQVLHRPPGGSGGGGGFGSAGAVGGAGGSSDHLQDVQPRMLSSGRDDEDHGEDVTK